MVLEKKFLFYYYHKQTAEEVICVQYSMILILSRK